MSLVNVIDKNVKLSADVEVNAMEWALISHVSETKCSDWLELIDVLNESLIISEVDKLEKTVYMFERAVRALPFSFKIWTKYIHYCKTNVPCSIDRIETNQSKNNSICMSTNEWFQWIRSLYTRALEQLPQMPLLWTEYIKFIIEFPIKRITMTRQVIYAALHALPVTQHRLIWNIIRQWLKTNNANVREHDNNNNNYYYYSYKQLSIPHETVRALFHLYLYYQPTLRNAQFYFKLLQHNLDFDGLFCECYSILTATTSLRNFESINLGVQLSTSSFSGTENEVEQRVKLNINEPINTTEKGESIYTCFQWPHQLAVTFTENSFFWQVLSELLQTPNWFCTLTLEELQKMMYLIKLSSEANFSSNVFRLESFFALFLCGQGYINEARNILHRLLSKAPSSTHFNDVYKASVEIEDALINLVATRLIGSSSSSSNSREIITTHPHHYTNSENVTLYNNMMRSVFNENDVYNKEVNNTANEEHHNQKTTCDNYESNDESQERIDQIKLFSNLRWLVDEHDLLLNQSQLRNSPTNTGLWLKRVELLDEKFYSNINESLSTNEKLESTRQKTYHDKEMEKLNDKIDLLKQAIAQCVTGMESVENDVGELYNLLSLAYIEKRQLNEALKLLNHAVWHTPFQSKSVNMYLLGMYIELVMLTSSEHNDSNNNNNNNDNREITANNIHSIKGNKSFSTCYTTEELFSNLVSILNCNYYNNYYEEEYNNNRMELELNVNQFNDVCNMNVKNNFSTISNSNSTMKDKIHCKHTSLMQSKISVNKTHNKCSKNGLIMTKTPLSSVVSDPRMWVITIDLCIFYNKFSILEQLINAYSGIVTCSTKQANPHCFLKTKHESACVSYATEAVCQAVFHLFKHHAYCEECKIHNKKMECQKQTRGMVAQTLLYNILGTLSSNKLFSSPYNSSESNEENSKVVHDSYVFTLSQYITLVLLSEKEKVSLYVMTELKKMTEKAIENCFVSSPVSVIELAFSFTALSLRYGRSRDAVYILEAAVRISIVAWKYNEGNAIEPSETTEGNKTKPLVLPRELMIIYGLVRSVILMKFKYHGIESVRVWCTLLLPEIHNAELTQWIVLHWASFEKRIGNMTYVHKILDACAQTQNPHTIWGVKFWTIWESACNELSEFRHVAQRKEQVATLFAKYDSYNKEEKAVERFVTLLSFKKTTTNN